MTRAALVVVGLAACHPGSRVEHVATPTEGVAIALYDAGNGVGYGVVDDRRWIEVTAGRAITLERIDPGATLPSLVIEPLAGGALELGPCSRATFDRGGAMTEDALEERKLQQLRDRLDGKPTDAGKGSNPLVATAAAPTVTCEVAHAEPGRHLVRILYVSTTLGYKPQHDLAMTTADHAVVSSHFAITTPPWHVRGEVVLFDGVPGGDRPPREITRGPIALDGSTAVVVVPPHDVPAHLRRIYDGALIVPGVPETDLMWNHRSHGTVWVWLELDQAAIAPGSVRVHVALPGEDPRDIVVPATARQAEVTRKPVRLPLWEDPDLRGMRQPGIDYGENAAMADRMLYSITNVGSVPHEVWIEERLRSAKHRRVVRAWPTKPAIHDDILREKVTIAPGKIARVGFTVDYDF